MVLMSRHLCQWESTSLGAQPSDCVESAAFVRVPFNFLRSYFFLIFAKGDSLALTCFPVVFNTFSSGGCELMQLSMHSLCMTQRNPLP